jgi:hypothetical protein
VPQTDPAFSLHGELRVADIDGDGDDDIVVDVWDDGIFTVLGDGAGQFGEAQRIENAISSLFDSYDLVDVRDVDGDQRVDLITTPFSEDGLFVIPGEGTGFSSTAHWELEIMAATPGPFAFGDPTGDGIVDMVQQAAVQAIHSQLRLAEGYANESGAGFAAGVTFGETLSDGRVVVGDVNADGRDDVVSIHAGELDFGLSLSTPAGMGPLVLYDVPAGASELAGAAIGDVNCDGCPDVITTNVGGIVYYLGQGCGS